MMGELPRQDFFQAARVCKGWHLARENAVPYGAREEGMFMLHDDHRWSDHLCESALVKTTSFFYETDGFAFVPFSQRTFPQGSARLSDEDVAPFFDTLYAHAFGVERRCFPPKIFCVLKLSFPGRVWFTTPQKNAPKTMH
jgi:hypothetical protein